MSRSDALEKTSEILKRYGIPLKKSLGQHFLSNQLVAQRIVELAGLRPGDVVLEVGAGAGTLTLEIAKTGAHVYAVEIDERLEPVLRERCGNLGNVVLIFSDFLRLDLGFLPSGFRCVSNIPYNLTGPILKRLVFTDFSDLVLMVQREVGERLVSPPGRSGRGFLSVVLQTIGEVGKILQIPQSAFVPNPSVESVVIRVVRKRDLPFGDLEQLHDYWSFVSAAFARKRKTIFNNLRSFLSDRVAKAVLVGVPLNLRPEELTCEQFVELWRRVRELRMSKTESGSPHGV